MTWNATTPDDDTYPANLIHTQIQNDKEMIRERLEASDGTIKAHNAADSSDSGKHLPSQVGWVKVHATEAAMNTWASGVTLVEGSLHYATSEGSLWVVDSTPTLIKIYPVDHLALTDKDTGDDHNYQKTDMSKAMTGDLRVLSLTLTGATLGGDDDPLDVATHEADDWETAHGAGKLGNEHFRVDSIYGEDFAERHTWSGSKLALVADTYGLPWHRGDGTDTGFAHLRVYNDGMAFYDGGALVDGTMACGKFKT